MSSSNNKNPAEDVSKAGATSSSVADDAALRQKMFHIACLLNGVDEEDHNETEDAELATDTIMQLFAQYTAAAVQAARADELILMCRKYWQLPIPEQAMLDRIKELEADAGRSGEGTDD